MSSTSRRALGPNHRMVELCVAVATGLFSLLVIGGSWQVGVSWDVDGPGAGFFPFYVGVMILGASIVNFIQIWSTADGKLFAEWSALRQVSFVVAPTALYVALIPFIGIYFASMLLVAAFMKFLGRYGWTMIAAVSIGVPVVTFIVFERWFLVPLPKGPIENWLGF